MDERYTGLYGTGNETVLRLVCWLGSSIFSTVVIKSSLSLGNILAHIPLAYPVPHEHGHRLACPIRFYITYEVFKHLVQPVY